VAAKVKRSILTSTTLQQESDDERESRLDAVLGQACGISIEYIPDRGLGQFFNLSPVCRKNFKHSKAGKIPTNPKIPSKIILQGVFWNNKGFGDLAKHGFLADLVKEEQINFRALPEIEGSHF
jgi:hypothetical protein